LTRIVFAVLSVTIQLSRFCFRSERDFTSPVLACQGPRDRKNPKPNYPDFGSSDRQVTNSGLWRKTVSSIVSDLPVLGLDHFSLRAELYTRRAGCQGQNRGILYQKPDSANF